MPALDLGTHSVDGALDKLGLDPTAVDQLTFGIVTLDARVPHLAREINLSSELPPSVRAHHHADPTRNTTGPSTATPAALGPMPRLPMLGERRYLVGNRPGGSAEISLRRVSAGVTVLAGAFEAADDAVEEIRCAGPHRSMHDERFGNRSKLGCGLVLPLESDSRNRARDRECSKLGLGAIQVAAGRDRNALEEQQARGDRESVAFETEHDDRDLGDDLDSPDGEAECDTMSGRVVGIIQHCGGIEAEQAPHPRKRHLDHVAHLDPPPGMASEPRGSGGLPRGETLHRHPR